VLIEKYTQEFKKEFNLTVEEAKKYAMFLLGFIQNIVSSEIDKYVEPRN